MVHKITHLALVVKNLPAKAGNIRDSGWTPEWGRSPEVGNDNPHHCPFWEIPWTEEPVGIWSTGSQRAGND